jgi:hypothetical protein
MLRTVLSILFLSVAGCSRSASPKAPDAVVLSYLKARVADTRLQMLLDPKVTQPLLAVQPLLSSFSFDEVQVQPPQRLTHVGEWYGVRAGVRKGPQVSEFLFYVAKTADDFKIDWLATAGCNLTPLHTIRDAAGDGPRRYRVNARLAGYYYYEFWGTESRYQSVELTEIGTTTTVYGFVDKYSDVGVRLSRLLRDEVSHPVTLDLARLGPRGNVIENSESDVVKIVDFVGEGWLY